MINNIPPIDPPKDLVVIGLRSLVDRIEKGQIKIKTVGLFGNDYDKCHTVIISKWDLAYALGYIKNDIEAAGVSPGGYTEPKDETDDTGDEAY